jgi:hypothetical protein
LGWFLGGFGVKSKSPLPPFFKGGNSNGNGNGGGGNGNGNGGGGNGNGNGNSNSNSSGSGSGKERTRSGAIRRTPNRYTPTYRVPPFEKGGPGGICFSLNPTASYFPNRSFTRLSTTDGSAKVLVSPS